MDSKNLLRIGGICAIVEALIYITAFIIYGVMLVYPNTNASAVEEVKFLTDNYVLLSIMNLVSYVLFGILLAVLVLAIHQKLKTYAPPSQN